MKNRHKLRGCDTFNLGVAFVRCAPQSKVYVHASKELAWGDDNNNITIYGNEKILTSKNVNKLLKERNK